MSLRSRRPARAARSDSGPIVYSLDSLYNESFVNSRRGRSWARVCLVVVNFTIVFFCLIVHLYPEEVKSTASTTWSALFAARCSCTLSVVSLLKDGRPHPCKDYCSDQLQWTLAPKPWTTPKNPYGSFAVFGKCKKEEILSLKNTSISLIPRSSTSHLPDFQSLVELRLRDIEILFIGGSILKQTVDMLPSVVDDSTLTISDEHFSYDESGGGISPIKQCFTDLKTTTQKCWRNEKVRATCTCSMVTTFQWTSTNTTIRFVEGYGIEFDLDKKKQMYGLSYNIVKEPLYSKLAQTASLVVVDVDVLARSTKHDTEGFSNLLKFIQHWSVQQKVVYRLTMPQHYATHDPALTYIDEPIKRQSCVAAATQRHWTNALAQEMLRGVDMIDLFPMAATLGHLHSHQKGDCSSWCMVYDLFYVFWATLADAIHTPSAISRSDPNTTHRS